MHVAAVCQLAEGTSGLPYFVNDQYHGPMEGVGQGCSEGIKSYESSVAVL